MPAGDVTFWPWTLSGFTTARPWRVDATFTGGPGDATVPALSNITPAAGSELDHETGVAGFDVTDLGANLTRRPTVLAWYPELRLFEVVYFETAIPEFAGGFAPGYLGAVAGISNGFRFSGVQRRGGWPSRPIFVVDPTDAAGNVSV